MIAHKNALFSGLDHLPSAIMIQDEALCAADVYTMSLIDFCLSDRYNFI